VALLAWATTFAGLFQSLVSSLIPALHSAMAAEISHEERISRRAAERRNGALGGDGEREKRRLQR
jgi:hypothetical protein